MAEQELLGNLPEIPNISIAILFLVWVLLFQEGHTGSYPQRILFSNRSFSFQLKPIMGNWFSGEGYSRTLRNLKQISALHNKNRGGVKKNTQQNSIIIRGRGQDKQKGGDQVLVRTREISFNTRNVVCGSAVPCTMPLIPTARASTPPPSVCTCACNQ